MGRADAGMGAGTIVVALIFQAIVMLDLLRDHFEPDSLQIRFMQAVVFAHQGGPVAYRDIRPQLRATRRAGVRLTAAQRRAELVAQGWIELSRQGRVLMVRGTLQGQRWLQTHGGSGLAAHDGSARDGQKPVFEQIQDAYRQLVDAEAYTRVRIADLVEVLSDLDRQSIQQALLAMNRSGQVLLVPGENPHELSWRDHQCAVHLAGYIANHFMRMEC